MACQTQGRAPVKAPMHPWEWPVEPWSRIHADYGGPVDGQMLLVMGDAHSKWIKVGVSSQATRAVTIQHMREAFSRHGLPRTLVTDNGPCFSSEEFQVFLKANSIRHVKTAPYHPASNGLAEKAVGTITAALAKKTGSLRKRLAEVLLASHTTPQSTTGQAP